VAPLGSLTLPDRPSVVAIDLDGTLLDSAGVLRSRGRDAVLDLIQRDIRVAIATARPGRAVAKLLDPQIFEAVDLVHVDGAVIDRRGDAHPRHQHPLPEGVARTVADLASHALPDARVILELEGWEFGSDRPGTAEELWTYNSATPEMVLSVDAAIERGPVKVAINGIEASVDGLAELLATELGDRVRLLHHREGTFLSVVAPGVGKRGGVARLLEGGDTQWQSAIAFGDDYSDIELLEACGVSFAMANAAPEVLGAARYRAASNDDEGVAQILEALVEQLD
jgi:hypothetical protein